MQTSIAPVQSIFSQLGWNGLNHSDRGSLDLWLCFFSIILFNLTFILRFIYSFFFSWIAQNNWAVPQYISIYIYIHSTYASNLFGIKTESYASNLKTKRSSSSLYLQYNSFQGFVSILFYSLWFISIAIIIVSNTAFFIYRLNVQYFVCYNSTGTLLAPCHTPGHCQMEHHTVEPNHNADARASGRSRACWNFLV